MPYADSKVADDSQNRFRATVVLAAGAALVLWVLAEGISIYGRLPAEVPIHFGLYGQPDGWSGKGVWSVLGMPMGAAVLLIVMAVVSRLSAKWYNFPGKERVLTLPKPVQDHIIAPMQESLAWLGAGIAIGISLAARDGWAVAMGQKEALGLWTMLGPIALGFVALLAGVLVTFRRLAQVEQSRGAGA
jgi:hypothetical protein